MMTTAAGTWWDEFEDEVGPTWSRRIPVPLDDFALMVIEHGGYARPKMVLELPSDRDRNLTIAEATALRDALTAAITVTAIAQHNL